MRQEILHITYMGTAPCIWHYCCQIPAYFRPTSPHMKAIAVKCKPVWHCHGRTNARRESVTQYTASITTEASFGTDETYFLCWMPARPTSQTLSGTTPFLIIHRVLKSFHYATSTHPRSAYVRRSLPSWPSAINARWGRWATVRMLLLAESIYKIGCWLHAHSILHAATIVSRKLIEYIQNRDPVISACPPVRDDCGLLYEAVRSFTPTAGNLMWPKRGGELGKVGRR